MLQLEGANMGTSSRMISVRSVDMRALEDELGWSLLEMVEVRVQAGFKVCAASSHPRSDVGSFGRLGTS